MPNLNTTLVRRNLARIVADLATAPSHAEDFRERAGRLSRLAGEVTQAYEAAFASSVDAPPAMEMFAVSKACAAT